MIVLDSVLEPAVEGKQEEPRGQIPAEWPPELHG